MQALRGSVSNLMRNDFAEAERKYLCLCLFEGGGTLYKFDGNHQLASKTPSAPPTYIRVLHCHAPTFTLKDVLTCHIYMQMQSNSS